MFQYRVKVQDGGSPPLSATTVLTINVIQNLRNPEFNADLCEASINEEFPTGTQPIDTVTATDADSKVCEACFIYTNSP